MNIISKLPIPDLKEAKRVLCVQPHYDDNDIGAGGTLAALKENGAEIYYLTVTDDLIGVVDEHLSDEEATVQLRREQIEAGKSIGVQWQAWLGYPDAGKIDYHEMRNKIIRYMRILRPDFVFTCDPWLPYEAHQDHVLTGRAVAEASLLHSLKRLKIDPEIDLNYQPYELSGIVFYYTKSGNAVVDISETHQRKHAALDCYKAQFSPDDLEMLHLYLEAAESMFAQDAPFEFGEALKVLQPRQLHVGIHTLDL